MSKRLITVNNRKKKVSKQSVQYVLRHIKHGVEKRRRGWLANRELPQDFRLGTEGGASLRSKLLTGGL